jgi:Fic family protein
VAQKHRELTSLELSPEQNDRIRKWVDVTFVYSTLRLEGLAVTEPDVAGAVAFSKARAGAAAEADVAIVELLAEIRLLRDLALREGTAGVLTPELLLRLHGGPAEFRKTPGETGGFLRPVAPEHLPASVDSACRWFSAESFAELNPIEQASIVHLRLLEIQPFAEGNQRIAILAASLFTLRSGLPPVMIVPDLALVYGKAVEESRSGNTQPMVELIGNAVEGSLAQMIRLAAQGEGSRI